MNLYDILCSDDIVKAIEDNMDYLLTIIPEIKYMINFDQRNPQHHLDVWNHTLLALSMSENNFDIRLVLLLHDIGKPFSYQDDEVGIRHFNNHPNVSAVMSKAILERLNFNEDYINKICLYIKNHDLPISNEYIELNYDDAYILFKIQTCDALAHNPDKIEKRKSYLKKIDNRLKEH